jgi:SAM-dependent methyltransferase
VKNRDNQFIESKFTFRGKSYFRILDNSTGYLQTIPLESPEYDIYETGHYSVKKYFLIPILLNLVDLIYIKLLLSKFKITKNSRILDFGCGKGYLVYFLSKIGYNKYMG